LGTTRRSTTQLVEIRTKEGAVVTTPDHLFAKAGSGWTPAGELADGDRVVSRAAPNGTPIAVTKRTVPATTVYNLTVDRTHSYLVGPQGLLAHNVNCAGPSTRHPSRHDLVEAHHVTHDEERAIHAWSMKAHEFRSLSLALAEHPELATMSYAEAEARGFLRDIRLEANYLSPDIVAMGFTPEREFEKLRRQLLVDIPSYIAKAPKYRGTVYRGLFSVPLQQIADWRQRLYDREPIELGIDGRPGYASATDDRRVAQDFAGPSSTDPDRASVLLVIEQHSGVSVHAMSVGDDESEVLIPAGARFRITSIAEGPPGNFTVHLAEM
jgi:hypothetical protein